MIPKASDVLAGLKPFQRDTVEYACKRFDEGCSRFLVADEVGLGKTKIANGILAKVLEGISPRARTDILYVCSNSAIARKNLRVLDAAGGTRQESTRLTLLPFLLEDEQATRRGVNLLSLTPGTSFDPASSMGWARERALIRNAISRNRDGRIRLDELLEGQASKYWDVHLRNARVSPDNKVIVGFKERIEALGLRRRVDAALGKKLDPGEAAQLVGRLRHELALASIESLRPALIIFDEFQRFSELFGTDGDPVDGSRQAVSRSLMDAFLKHEKGGRGAKVLFLSATPYRMLTLRHDDPGEGDHRKEFLKVIETLYGREEGPAVVAGLEKDFQGLRRALKARISGPVEDGLGKARQVVEAKLRPVISRTERIDPLRPDAGISRKVVVAPVSAGDLRQAKAANLVARKVEAPQVVEYWKSAPYMFSFMGSYKLADKARAGATAQLARMARPAMLPMARIREGAEVDPGNGRMRLLASEVLDEAGLHRRLWLPPSLGYLEGNPKGLTKTLVFSAWQMVPEAIAGMLSYEAERRVRSEAGLATPLPKTHSQALRFQASADHLEASARAMVLVHPSKFLSEVVDPLEIWRRSGSVSRTAMIDAAKAAIREAWPEGLAGPGTDAPWSLIPQLDALCGGAGEPQQVHASLAASHAGTGWADVYRAFVSTTSRGEAAAAPEDATLDYLARVALGSPATCARRALGRYLSGPLAGHSALVADAFVSLFNKREVAPILAAREGAAWSSVLATCIDHDLQAVLDEYFHLLTGGEDLQGAARDDVVETAARVIGLRNSAITIHDPFRKTTGRQRDATLPAHLAVRFAANVMREDDGQGGGEHRIDALVDAFNSPFRPFVLASTSVGQEGLDFHRYCRRVWHWNLPSNPVDLEQREGRIQRFLGHAVRVNLSARFGEQARAIDASTPWSAILQLAADEQAGRDAGQGPEGLVPYWLYDGETRIESVIPVPPMSRDADLAERVQKSAASYRLVFGQARQDDLIRVIGQLGEDEIRGVLEDGLISLRPPAA